MRLLVLGKISIDGPEQVRPKQMILLTYFAHEGQDGKWFSQEKLSELFYSESKRSSGTSKKGSSTIQNLYNEVKELRKIGVEVETKSKQIRVLSLTTDALEVFAACANKDLKLIQKLYKGPFLESYSFKKNQVLLDVWARPEREKLEQTVWRAFLDTTIQQLSNKLQQVPEQLDIPYELTGTLPCEHEDFRLLYTTLFYSGNTKTGRWQRRLSSFIDEFGIQTDDLPSNLEEARRLLKVTEPQTKSKSKTEPSSVPSINKTDRQKTRDQLLMLVQTYVKNWQLTEPELNQSLRPRVRLDFDQTNHPQKHHYSSPVTPKSFDNFSIPEVVETLGCFFLLVGATASGKTAFLYELTEHLVLKAEYGAAVPVIFNLSSWSKQTTLYDWLLQELKARYYISGSQSKDLLKNFNTILVLDGLDEVRLEYRLSCFKAINMFSEDQSLELAGLIVSCRFQDYISLTEQAEKLKLFYSLYLEALTTKQITTYFTQENSLVANWWQHIQTHEPQSPETNLKSKQTFKQLLNNPLMAQAFANLGDPSSLEGLEDSQISETLMAKVFDKLIESSFQQPKLIDKKILDKRATLDKLEWLAKTLQGFGQTYFLIEHLQPSWIEDKTSRRLYLLLSRTLGTIVAGLVFGLFLGGASSLAEILFNTLPKLQLTPIKAITFGFTVGSVVGISIASYDIFRFELKKQSMPLLLLGLSLLLSLVLYYLTWNMFELLWFPKISMILLAVFIVATFFILSVENRKDLNEDFDPWQTDIEKNSYTDAFVGWSFPRSLAIAWADHQQRKRVLATLSAGIISFMLAFGFRSLQQSTWPSYFLFGCLFLFLSFALVMAIGLPVDRQIRILPSDNFANYGIKIFITRTVSRGLLIAPACFTLVYLLSIYFISTIMALENTTLISFKQSWGDHWGVMYTSIMASFLVFHLFYCHFIDVIKHFVLRLILYAQKKITWNYAQFLNQAEQLRLIKKAGGGYAFLHLLLRSYLAANSKE